MPEGIKDYKRLATAAFLHNDNQHQYVVLEFVDHDGGYFELHPKITDNAIILADVNRAAYGLQIQGNPAALKRVANALNTLARNMEGDSDSE